MNSQLIYAATVAVALLGSGAAFAAEDTVVPVPAGERTRAEVKAELQQARAAGELNIVSAAYGRLVNPAPASERSRADVSAEARGESRTGRVAAKYLGA